MPILLDKKRGGNRCAFGRKTSFKAAFVILPLHNSFKDAFLLFPLQSLIILSSFCPFVIGLGVGVFGKDNIGKHRADNPKTKVQGEDANRKDNSRIGTNINGKTRVDNLGTGIDADAKIDNPSKTANNPYIAVNDPNKSTDNSGIVIDNSSIANNNLDTAANYSGTVADNPDIAIDNLSTETNENAEADNSGTETDAYVGVDNLSTAASNKACAKYFFALRCAFFLIAFFFEWMTASLPSSLLSSFSTILQ